MKQQNNTTKVKCLREAVALTPDVCGHFCEGKGAITEGKSQISVEDNGKLYGSVNIDLATRKIEKHSRSNRWDYVIEYGGNLHYIEVHPAYGEGKINDIKQKMNWLQSWLRDDAPYIKKLAPFPMKYWVATGRIDLGKVDMNSKQWRKINIPRPVKCLTIR